MTTRPMDCESFSDRLLAYLEHETDDETRAAIERHSLSCAECGVLLADLRTLRIEAANLPELSPSRDLWSGISARIEAPVVPIGTVRQVEQRRSQAVRRWTRAALIAATLVMAAGVGYFAAVRRTEVLMPSPVAQVPESVRPSVVEAARPPEAATQEPTAQSPRTRITNVVDRGGPPPIRSSEEQQAVATLNKDYGREIARLRALIEQRRNQLDPVTVAIIEKNLQVIDAAIAECKKAIAHDPASRFLIESLNQSLQTKVELMRTAALLPTRT